MSQCRETVYVRDTYRYSGRGRDGFSMHYTRKQCSRSEHGDTGYCWQHQHVARRVALYPPERPSPGTGERGCE